MTSVVIIIIGILFIVIGISAICFITIPSIFGIGEGAANIVDGEDVCDGLSNIIIGSLVLYLTTGLFIAITASGTVMIFVGNDKI